MKVLTIRQPWASLIVAGIKTIETRPAPPNGPMRPPGVRGLPGLPIEPGERIGIHAAITNTPGSDPIWQAVADAAPWLLRKPFELGQLIGTVEVPQVLPIVDFYDGTEEVDDETYSYLDSQLPLGDFTPGRWAWILAEPEPCDPQPMPGRQGVWEATP